MAAACAAGVFQPLSASADSLTLMWDLNTEPEVTGYEVRYGLQPGVYTQSVNVGNTDTYVLADAVPGQQYCFVVIAYAGTLSSPFSEEVCSSSANTTPFLSQPFNQSHAIGQSVALQLNAGDPNGDALVYSSNGLPGGLALSSATGLITGVPTVAGTFFVSVSVTDGTTPVTRYFTWTITTAGNGAPIVTNPGLLSHVVNQAVQVQIVASDPDGQAVTFSATGLPNGLTISGSGLVSGTPTTTGTYNVAVTASDGSLSGSTTFTWAIRPPNQAPVLTDPADQTTNANQAASLQLVASDPDGDTVTFVASGLPGGVQLSTTTGLISGTPTAVGTSTVTVTASDGRLLATQTFTWTVRSVNDTPVLAAPGNQTHDAGQAVVVQLQATDANGDPLTFSATGLPPGLQISTTGRISGVATTAGTYSVVATVSDGTATATRSFTWTIRAVNTPPVLTNPGNQSGQVGQSTSLQLLATDANNDTLTYNSLGLPPGLALAGSTGAISGIPTLAGVFEVTVTVSDGPASATQVFTWTVQDVTSENGAPTLSNPGTRRNNVGDTVALQLNGNDNDGDPISFTANGLPPGLSVNAPTGMITGSPTTAGRYTVTATVSDGTRSASQGFTWIIRVINIAPELTAPENRVDQVGLFTALSLQATDANGDTLTYSATGLPNGLQLATDTGVITGTPTTVGTFAVSVSVNDGSVSRNASFTWTIDPRNNAPSLLQPGNQFSVVGQQATVQLQAADSDGDPLLYTATGLPAGLAVSASSGLIAGVPTSAGTYTVTVTVSDAQLSVQRSFTWSVQPANVAPMLTNPGSQTTTTGQTVQLQLQATDANSDPLVFAVAGLPPGLQLSNTGIVSGIPTTAGTYSVTATVTDGALSAQQVFTWLIRQANVAPAMVTPAAQTSVEGDAIMLQMQASDLNGDTLTFVASGLPPGLQVSSTTGWIAGMVTTAGTYVVTVAVSDGALTTQRSFGWTVLTPAVAEQTTTRRTEDAVLTGTTATVRQSVAETTTRVYTGTTAKTRTPAPAPTPTPQHEYTSQTAVIRTVATAVPTLALTGSTATVRGGDASGVTGEMLTSLLSARSIARTTEAPTTQTSTTSSAGATSAVTSKGAPKLTIETPVADARFATGGMVHFMATAKDYSGLDLSDRIVWSSSVDGALGTGASLIKTLSNGSHVITARVTDRRGRITTVKVTIVVG